MHGHDFCPAWYSFIRTPLLLPSYSYFYSTLTTIAYCYSTAVTAAPSPPHLAGATAAHNRLELSVELLFYRTGLCRHLCPGCVEHRDAGWYEIESDLFQSSQTVSDAISLYEIMSDVFSLYEIVSDVFSLYEIGPISLVFTK